MRWFSTLLLMALIPGLAHAEVVPNPSRHYKKMFAS